VLHFKPSAQRGVHRTVIERLLPSQGPNPPHPTANSEKNMFRNADGVESRSSSQVPRATFGRISFVFFLGAESDYRSIQLSYWNLVASHMKAANQLNLATGREVLP